MIDSLLQYFFAPVKNEIIGGCVNPLQFFTYDFRKRKAKKITTLQTNQFALARQMVMDILS
ncbi:pemK family growth inhibitor [Companilactobacillus sp. HBUAS56257]|uniref:pemK family growth inhibitor n=1 Tax=Companilactobacillus sp. HBUAS56257 TaxID=3109360 RepID=UPI002FF0D73B